MKKALVIAAVFVGLGVLARRFSPKMGNIDWGKKLEAIPDNSPPKRMIRNITAIRENTDRICSCWSPASHNRPGTPRRRHLITDAGTGTSW
jgi:hypothetical protein